MILPSDNSYKTFSDLVSGYRVTAAMIKAVEMGIIETIGLNGSTIEKVIESCKLKVDEGNRFINLLIELGFFEKYNNNLFLTQFSSKFLYSKSEFNQLAALEFEPRQINNWFNTDKIIKNGQGYLLEEKSENEYKNSLSLYQKAMHDASAIRSLELWNKINITDKDGLIIDIGTGDGTYLHSFLKFNPNWKAIGCDLQDVIDLNICNNNSITYYPINFLEESELENFIYKHKNSASIILLSNFIHCYNENENFKIFKHLIKLLKDDGIIIIHDFFSDVNSFGALYDIHMLTNTYSGKVYSTKDTIALLKEFNFTFSKIIELESYSTSIAFSKVVNNIIKDNKDFNIKQRAKALSFFYYEFIDPGTIITKPWVNSKCEYGCKFFSKKWSCPPNSMTIIDFKNLLADFKKAILVAGQPPLKDFQNNLLELEKGIFLMGFKKAIAFTGGPCSWCEECDEIKCRFPEKRRPSLESCGCDVFELANSNGIHINPISSDNEFVTYIGLVLVD